MEGNVEWSKKEDFGRAGEAKAGELDAKRALAAIRQTFCWSSRGSKESYYSAGQSENKGLKDVRKEVDSYNKLKAE